MGVSPAEMVAASWTEAGVRTVVLEGLDGVAGGLAAAVLLGNFDAANAFDSAVVLIGPLAGDGIRSKVAFGAAVRTKQSVHTAKAGQAGLADGSS